MGYIQFSSVAQSCLTLCDPKNCSTPGLPVYHQSHVQLFATPWIQESSWNSPDQNTGVGSLFLLQGISPIQRSNPGLPDSLPADSQGKPKNTGVGSLSLLQGIFPTQKSNRGLLHCRQVLYQLSYQGSPNLKIMEDKGIVYSW